MARRSAYRLDPRAARRLEDVQLGDLEELSDEELVGLAAQAQLEMALELKENQLLYYLPNSATHLAIHQSTAHKLLIGGGNRSGKTTTVLAHIAACATGVVPLSLRDAGIDWDTVLRGPVKCRFVCANLETTLEPMLKQLKWDEWDGADAPGGVRGHWGFIPRTSLRDGSWKASWSQGTSTLTVLYRDPATGDTTGESTIQFMSHNQTAQSMASVNIHHLVLDEVPPYSVYRESAARTMGVNGTIYLPMTWPDEPTINVDWLFDEIYDKALPGPNRDPDVAYFQIATASNPNVDQVGVAKQEASYARVSGALADTRMRGAPIRFSNRVHPLFTDTEDWYCHECGTLTHVEHGVCGRSRRDPVTSEPFICLSPRVHTLAHVREFDFNPGWPVVWVVDPHPRKPHMSAYFALRPDNKVFMVAELEVIGDATDVRVACDDLESTYSMHVRARIGDPRALAWAHGMDRTRTWLDEFHAAGLYVEQARSDMDSGIATVNQWLRPDEYTHAPHLTIHPRCRGARLQLARFMWDDWKGNADKDQKQQTKKKYDDYPGIVRYFANGEYTYHNLLHGMTPVRTINLRRPTAGAELARRQRYTTQGRAAH